MQLARNIKWSKLSLAPRLFRLRKFAVAYQDLASLAASYCAASPIWQGTQCERSLIKPRASSNNHHSRIAESHPNTLYPTSKMPATTAETLSLVTRSVSVAPLVLLSAVDHYNRGGIKQSKNKRVVGVLLGQNDGKNVRVSNSFAGMHPVTIFNPSLPLCEHI